MPDALPDIAVIVATYRRPHLITRALDSIARQKLAPREIVVVDDASGDDTGAVVGDWQRRSGFALTFLAMRENAGAGAARNLGMAATTAPLIGFLDSDDEYLPNALAVLAAPFATHLAAAVSFADAMQSWTDGTPSRPMMRRCLTAGVDTTPIDGGLHRVNDPRAALLLTSMIPTCAALFRRDAAAAVGWMPAYRHGEDWLFWLKLTTQGEFVCRFDDLAHVYRQGDNLTGSDHAVRHARQLLGVLLGIRDGRFGIVPTAAERTRLDAAIATQAGYLRYNASRKGLATYWRITGTAEARATGGRLGHLAADPKSLVRAAWFGLG